ncbi:MAG: T9SS type A sorting domain-containing protein [Ferruginibacter sp.]
MKKKFTKKICLFSCLLLAAGLLNAQSLLTEDFNFSDTLSAQGWTAHSGQYTRPIGTTTGLTYAGLPGSGVGNAALIKNAGGEDDNRMFTAQNTPGQDIYYSFLVNVTEAAANKNGDYFFHLGTGTGTSFSMFAARVFVKVTANVVNFGISNSSVAGTVAYGTTSLAKNTTYLIIVKHTLSVVPTDSDTTNMWVLSSGVPATEALAGTPEAFTDTTIGQTTLNSIGLRQGSSSNSVETVVDAVKIGLTWADVTTGGTLPIKLEYIKGQKSNHGIALNWKVTCLSTNIQMEIERSSTTRSFSSINAIGATQARCAQPFDFVDPAPLKGRNYYRLKMIDIDGKVSYSPIVAINGSKGLDFVGLYPSLVTTKTSLSISADKNGIIETLITDMNGRIVKSAKSPISAGASLVEIDCTNLAPGIYTLTGITDDASTSSVRFIKQ